MLQTNVYRSFTYGYGKSIDVFYAFVIKPSEFLLCRTIFHCYTYLLHILKHISFYLFLFANQLKFSQTGQNPEILFSNQTCLKCSLLFTMLFAHKFSSKAQRSSQNSWNYTDIILFYMPAEFYGDFYTKPNTNICFVIFVHMQRSSLEKNDTKV